MSEPVGFIRSPTGLISAGDSKRSS
jgi:hypothetical protein